MQTRFWYAFSFALMSVTAFVAPLPVWAGTTGQLIGVVTDTTTGAFVAGTKVTAAGPSDIRAAVTDASGRFAILDLAPDIYVVSFELPGYRPVAVSGVTITADVTKSIAQTLSVASSTAGSSSSSLRPGSPSGDYAIDGLTQFKTSLADGAGFANSAYSALSTVPGVFVPSDQMGIDPAVSIRGGGEHQVVFGIDGVPVNVPYNNAPGGPASSLGQQELDVYTGSPPANSTVQGISGVIDQVIRTGTTPGFTTVQGVLGGPGFYHQLAFETGGATTNRNFSYYVGLGGYDQAYRFADNFNGRGVGQLFGIPISPCADAGVSVVPSCYLGGKFAGTGVNAFNPLFGTVDAYSLGAGNLFGPSQINDRNNVVNLHFEIPRKNGLKDDLQLLGMVDYLKTYYYDSTNDLGGAGFLAASGFGTPSGGVPYVDGLQFNAPTGVFLPANYKSLTSPYLFPYSPKDRSPGSFIEPGLEDSETNNQAIAKVQYTHPFSQNALIKIFGYTDYLNQSSNGLQSLQSDFDGTLSADFEVSNHARGFGTTFVDQLDAHNQLQLAGSYYTATGLAIDNDEDIALFLGPLARVVDGAHPTNGLCYAVTGGPALSCNDPNAGAASFQQAYAGTIAPATGTCGAGPCRYLVINNGEDGYLRAATPAYTAASITDDFRPSPKLSIEGGVRVDNYQYRGAVTNDGNVAQAFLYNAFNLDNCFAPPEQFVPKAPTAKCPAGTTAVNFENPKGRATQSATEVEPRLRASYAVDRDTLFQATYARIAQPQNSSQVQEDSVEPAVNGLGYALFGINTPNRIIAPATSNNYDVSFEHVFGDASLRLTPFYKTTQHQLTGFFYSPFGVAFSDVTRQTSRGVEFEFDKGHFDRNGLAARLTATYTNSLIHYLDYAKDGSGVFDPANTAIAEYNAYTSSCAPGGRLAGKSQYGLPVCGSIASGVVGSPCYSAATSGADGSAAVPGVAQPCSAAGSVGNPYWNAPAQNLIDPKADFPNYQVVPGPPGDSFTSYSAPYVASLTLNYKRGPFAITPLVTLQAGLRYGEPESTYGVSPELCGGLSGAIPSDPRYPYGNPGGAGFDATSIASQVNGCASGLLIPNPYSHRFDAIGAFVEPAIAQLQIQMAYDVSRNFQVVAGLANVITDCFGGSKEPWNVKGACGYTVQNSYGTASGDIGNQYNPGAVIQPYLNTPYLPTFAQAPFGFGLGAKLKL